MYDAVIVGAGPAGSSLACSLAAEGWRVLLVERDHFPRYKVCGEFLSPEAQKTLAALGLYETIAALEPVPLVGGRLTAHNGRSVKVKMPGQAWGISRYALDAALAAAAEQRGAELWTGTTATNWQEASGAITVQMRRAQGNNETEEGEGEQTQVHACAVIVACGRHSLPGLLPSRATHAPRKSTRKLGVGINCHFTQLSMPAQVELYLFRGGYVGVNPVEKGQANICVLASYPTFARAGRSPAAMIEAAARWNPAFGQRLRGAQPLPESERSVAPVDTRRKARAWDGTPLLGDTAVMIPPLFGDGMAMALRSGELCAPLVDSYLRGQISWQTLGERYERLWHREFDRRLRLGRLLDKMLRQRKTSNLLFHAGGNVPLLADYLVRKTRGRTAKSHS